MNLQPIVKLTMMTNDFNPFFIISKLKDIIAFHKIWSNFYCDLYLYNQKITFLAYLRRASENMKY